MKSHAWFPGGSAGQSSFQLPEKPGQKEKKDKNNLKKTRCLCLQIGALVLQYFLV